VPLFGLNGVVGTGAFGSTNIDNTWYTGGSSADTNVKSLFAFSNILTVPQADAPSAPEPATLTLMLVGIGGLVGYGWRKRKQPRA
jgi:hypothetical protein